MRAAEQAAENRELPKRPVDWHADLIEEGERHLAFLDRVTKDRRLTSAPGYLDAQPRLISWCRDLVKFASCRGIDHERFRDFPQGWNWDQLDQVTEVD